MRAKRRAEMIDEIWQSISQSVKPDDNETRKQAAEILAKFGKVRAVTLIGTTHWNFRKLMDGQHPSAGLRRAIWYTHCLLFHPEKLETLFDLATWGRFKRVHRPIRRPQDGSDYQI